LHDFGREGAVLAERGRMLRELGHLDAAVACFERGLPMLQSSHRTAAEALAITGLANVRWEQGRFDEAETLHGTALAMFRAIGDRAGEGRATCDLAAVLHGRGHFAAAAARFHDALAVHREVGDRRMEGNILCNLGACLIEIGGHAEARAHLEASRVLCAETGDRRGEGVAMYNLGDACIEADEPEVAELWLARAMAVARELDNARGLAFAQANLGRVRWMRGDLRAAAARLHEAAQAFVTLGVPWAIGLVRSWEGAALADAGEEEAALAALARAADGRPTGDTAIMLRLSRAHVDALRARRGGPSARSAALGALREVRQDVPAPSANVRFSLRMLERSLGGLAT
jgi:tetratricopeptide (TPR) repeat protein